MDSHLKSLIVSAIDKVVAERSKNVTLVPAKTFEDYMRQVGNIHGLVEARDIIEETYSEYVRS